MALGRGLDALLGDSALFTQEGGSVRLPIGEVEPGLNQPRKYFDEKSIRELADSIRQYGIMQPLTVRRLRSGSYQIISGERRWRAAKIAGLDEVPATVIEADDRKVMELGLIENLQREDLNPMEEAAGYQALMQDYGLTQEETAKRLGKSRPVVANTMRLLALPKEIQEHIIQGNLSAGHGRVLLPLQDPKRQLALCGEILEKGYSVRETEGRVHHLLAEKTAEAEAPIRTAYETQAQHLTESLGRRVSISPGKKKGKIALEYYSEADLQLLMTALAALPERKEGRA